MFPETPRFLPLPYFLQTKKIVPERIISLFSDSEFLRQLWYLNEK